MSFFLKKGVWQMCRLWPVLAKPIAESGESQHKMEESVFGKYKYSQELGKTVQYLLLLNLRASGHVSLKSCFLTLQAPFLATPAQICCFRILMLGLMLLM
jgi:hypothetical protein